MSQAGVQRPHFNLQRYFTASHVREAPPEIGIALLAEDEARAAATRFTEFVMTRRADTSDDDGPLCHGWAIHAAFLAGAKWREEQGGSG